MQQQGKNVVVEETEDSKLVDCYRIAVDFGMSAALKAYEKLATDAPEKLEHENNSNSI